MSELAKIQVLQGPDLQREVARSKVYRYTLNSAALWILAGFAGICVVLGALSYFFASSPWSLVGLGVFGGLGAIFGITITYWYHVGEKMVVATNKEALMVGDMDKMWSFRWELLDAESIGLKDMAVTRASGRLMIKAGGQTVPLLLYSPFAHIDDTQGFMATVLEKVQAP